MCGPDRCAEQAFQQSARRRSHDLQPETARRIADCLPQAGAGSAVPLRICFAMCGQLFNDRDGRDVALGRVRWRSPPTLESGGVHHYPIVAKSENLQDPGSENKEHAPMPLDEKTTTELEAAAFRRLLEHLRARTDVQNIDLMNLAGFCRNCLSNWMKEAADARGVAMSKDESRETIYGMPYEEWKAKHQKEAAKDQQAAFEKTGHRH
jgi:hypothetical protein